MTRLALALVLLATGCTLRNANRAALALSSAALACDWGQTRSAARAGWVDYSEANPIMGPAPSTRTVDTYFVGALVLNAAIWYVIPDRFKSAIPVAVAGVQSRTIYRNTHTTEGTCGL